MIEDINGGLAPYYHGEGREWHRTPDGAIKRADIMRLKKIHAINKQIKKLEALDFNEWLKTQRL